MKWDGFPLQLQIVNKNMVQEKKRISHESNNGDDQTRKKSSDDQSKKKSRATGKSDGIQLFY